ncbi:BnaA01g24080D [Brassica napus]|uniref:BnaA01g24080D protein n=1 Tax=Brassica napus TaxID=3708 RepID=A0A078HDI6_BRANA|nr:BnaA01g24080D [Brassica napus]
MSNVKNMMCTTLTRSMPAIAFFGRMAFALVFIISAVQDYADHFGGGGGPLEKTVGPLVNVMTKYGSKVLTFYSGMQVVAFDVRLLEFSLITAKGTAALWFIFGQSIPAYFLDSTAIFNHQPSCNRTTNLHVIDKYFRSGNANPLNYYSFPYQLERLHSDDKPSTSKAKAN